MIRSPHRRLAQLDVSPGVMADAPGLVPQRLAGLSSRTAALELADALQPARRRAAVDLTSAVPLGRRAPHVLEPVRPRARRATVVPSLAPLPKFPVASIDLSKKDVTLPYGIGKYTNAATLKIIAGGHRTDQLLRRTRAGWEFVPDGTRIDLTDNRQEFRLGQLTIFS